MTFELHRLKMYSVTVVLSESVSAEIMVDFKLNAKDVASSVYIYSDSTQPRSVLMSQPDIFNGS